LHPHHRAKEVCPATTLPPLSLLSVKDPSITVSCGQKTEIMACSERTKRRKISAKVEEHLRLLEKESMIDDLLAHDSEKENPLDDLLEHTENEDSTDTFYDACDEICFENSSNDLDDENSSDSFYDFNISSFDDLDSENWVPGCDSDCDLHGDECSDLEDDNDDDSHGLAEWAAEFNIPQTA
ncbi:hypothetical protein PO909_028960, partial [Leuciscus waleckii]